MKEYDPLDSISFLRDALLAAVVMLVARVGMSNGGGAATMVRREKKHVLRVLGSVESSVRRIILTLALGRMAKGRLARRRGSQRGGGVPPKYGIARRPVFRLIDPRKYFAEIAAALGRTRPKHPKKLPRLNFDDDPEPEPPAPPDPTPDDLVDATAVSRRVQAVLGALRHLPREARRMQRRLETAQPGAKAPLRPGLPPGFRRRERHPVDRVLRECHILALRTIDAHDTS